MHFREKKSQLYINRIADLIKFQKNHENLEKLK